MRSVPVDTVLNGLNSWHIEKKQVCFVFTVCVQGRDFIGPIDYISVALGAKEALQLPLGA